MGIGLSQYTRLEPSLLQEIDSILKNMIERNIVCQCLHSKQHAFDAWRQVIEIILTACPVDLLQGEVRQTVLFEILQDLLIKVNDCSWVWGKKRQLQLIFDHNSPTLNDHGKRVFIYMVWIRRKCWISPCSPFPTMFSILSQTFSSR